MDRYKSPFYLKPLFCFFRGEIIIAGYVFNLQSTDPPVVELTYVTRADLKGLQFIPCVPIIFFLLIALYSEFFQPFVYTMGTFPPLKL
jgi:hypothetical protein